MDPMQEKRIARHNRILKAGTVEFGGGAIDCTGGHPFQATPGASNAGLRRAVIGVDHMRALRNRPE